MNKSRRKELNEWIKRANEWIAQGIEIRSKLESLCSDEENYFDNMPENLQSSFNGTNSEEAIEAMNEAIECIDSAIESAEEASSCIEDII